MLKSLFYKYREHSSVCILTRRPFAFYNRLNACCTTAQATLPYAHVTKVQFSLFCERGKRIFVKHITHQRQEK